MSAPQDALVAAERAQRTAADPRKSVFVRANAGSGKTKVLVDRIARLLLEGAAPGNFLCITFTKAAAAEMQRRLFQRLGAWCVASDDDLMQDLKALHGGAYEANAEVLARARALFARALETPGGLKIQTIHAFCERLLARFPLEAGVAPGFEIVDDAARRDMRAYAFADVLRDPSLASAVERQALRSDGEALQNRLSRLLALLSPAWLDARDAALRNETLSARHGAPGAPEDVKRRLMEGVDWRAIEGLISALQDGSTSDVKCAEALEAAKQSGAFEDYLSVWLTDKFTPRAKLPTQKTAAKYPEADARFKHMQAEAFDAYRALCAAERLADVQSAVAMARVFAGAYGVQKDRRGALDFDDLIARASGLLNQAASAAWVLYKLDGGIDHVLIDEGQDTSPLQWALVRPIIAEFFAGESARYALGARTVFAVGDPKQSIYSFQGADPEGFEREAQALEQAAGAFYTAPELTVSFRSTPEILFAVDRVFAQPNAIMSVGPGVAVVTHLARRAGEEGCVELWPLAPKPDGEDPDPWDDALDEMRTDSAVAVLSARLALTIKEWFDRGEAVWARDGATGAAMLRPMRAGDILFLVRKRGPIFNQLLKALKRQGLPVAGADRMKLNEEIVVQDLLNLIRVAVDPSDDLTLACLLKSPWIGLLDDDADLFVLLHGRENGERAIDRLRRAEEQRFVTARAFVEDLIAHVHLSPYAFLSRVLERLDDDGVSGWRRAFERLGPEARDPMEELLARALNAPARGCVTLQDFVADIERDDGEVKREMEEAGDAIRLMTVHGSKGLEAPVVILPDTTAGFEKSPDEGVMVVDGEAYMVRGRDEDDPVSANARTAFEAGAERESARLLYVAMTRARDRLIVCGAARGNSKTGVDSGAWYSIVEGGLSNLGEAIDTPFGEGRRIGAAKRVARQLEMEAITAPAAPGFLYRKAQQELPFTAWRAPSQIGADGPLLSPRSALHPRLKRGSLIHGLLQRLPDVARHDRPRIADAWLRRHGVDDDRAAAWIKECLAVLDDPRFAAVFAEGSRAEAAFAATLATGQRLRGAFDRLCVSAREVLAVDFKTDRPAPKTPEATPTRILNQMAAYRAALLSIFPGRVVQCAIIWTDGPHLVALPDDLLESVWAQAKS